MGKEQNADKNPLSKLIKRAIVFSGGKEQGIAVLSADQRKAYPHIIYQLASSSPIDQVLLQATYETMRDAQFAIAMDVEDGKPDSRMIVRTSAAESRDQAAESALFLGLAEATRTRLNSQDEPSVDYQASARQVAGQLLGELVGNQKLYESFRKYYDGLRWGTDQERFVRTLFVHGTDFDPALLAQNINGGQLISLTYQLEMDLPYNETKGWYHAQPEQILASHPELDYRRLADEAFRATPEGQKLMKAYTELCGDMLANQNKRSLDSNITEDGGEIPRPRIPLSRHPIIEALVVSEVAVDSPRAKYDFGPSDLTDIILDSDSRPAHEALVTSINTRLPEDHRRVFDGPDEFGHKHRNIGSVLRAYKEAYTDDQRRGLLKQDLVRIIDAFTGDGAIAADVREENVAWREGSRNWSSNDEARDSTEVYKIKDIVRDLIKIGVTSPDPEIVARAEDLIARYVSGDGNEIMRPDALALSRADLMLVLLDAINEISTGAAQPAVIERSGVLVFRDQSIARQLREFAEQKIQSDQIRTTPDALLALANWRKFGISIDDKNPAERQARKVFEDLVSPANQLMEKQRQAKNQLLLNLLGQLAESGALTQSTEAVGLFEGLVKRIEFNAYDMHEVPNEYHALIELADNSNLSERQRADILWHVQNQFEYVNSKAVHLLAPVILDLYRVALGPVDAIRLPTRDTGLGFSAVVDLVRKHGQGIFRSASQDQLRILARYTSEVRNHAERIAKGAMLETGETREGVEEHLQEWQKESMRNLSNVMRKLKMIEKHYEEYLQIEAVRVFPHIYYPWLLEQFVPFWRGMQLEVRPGNAPSGDIINLYRALQELVNNKLTVRKQEEYTESFDAIEEGHVDSLLKVCYERMVVPHDIKYNRTVWQIGLPFTTSAIAHMPTVLLEQIKAKYPNSSFVRYLDEEHTRWNKKEDIEE